MVSILEVCKIHNIVKLPTKSKCTFKTQLFFFFMSRSSTNNDANLRKCSCTNRTQPCSRYLYIVCKNNIKVEMILTQFEPSEKKVKNQASLNDFNLNFILTFNIHIESPTRIKAQPNKSRDRLSKYDVEGPNIILTTA